ncbi:hypothetical protein [Paracoccus sp. Ld10]
MIIAVDNHEQTRMRKRQQPVTGVGGSTEMSSRDARMRRDGIRVIGQ